MLRAGGLADVDAEAGASIQIAASIYSRCHTGSRIMVAANGLRMPITLYEDAVLDGWHRYCACDQTGVEPKYVTFAGNDEDAVKLVAAANVMRRHLTAGERADAAASVAGWLQGRPKKGLPASISQDDAAELFGVSERAVVAAKFANMPAHRPVKGANLPTSVEEAATSGNPCRFRKPSHKRTPHRTDAARHDVRRSGSSQARGRCP